ncbi:hypothetical protein BH23CHL2_BH23CHL2_19690 [soil metagenome]
MANEIIRVRPGRRIQAKRGAAAAPRKIRPRRGRKALRARPAEGTLLGYDIQGGEAVRLGFAERQQGAYILGGTGTGKSTLLENLVAQDLANPAIGICVIEPHGDLIDALLERVPAERAADVILVDPLDIAYPFGLNLFECPDPNDPIHIGRTTALVMGVFEKLWGPGSPNPSWGPQLAEILRNATLTLIENPGMTLAEVPLLLTDAEFRARLVVNVTNRQVRLFWEQRYNPLRPAEQLQLANSTLNKVSEFLNQPLVAAIFGQSATTLNLRRAMDQGKIVLIPIPVGLLGDAVTNLIGSTLVGQILTAALGRADLPPQARRRFHLYVDEYQRFATPDFAVLLAEARKMNIATVVAHQYRDQFGRGDRNRGATLNVANKIVFTISGEDAAELAAEFDATPPPPEVVGQRPRLTVSTAPVEYLLRNGHEDRRVRAFVEKQLSSLAFWSKSDALVLVHLRTGTCATPRNLQLGLKSLNQYAIDVMLGRFHPTSTKGVRRVVAIVVQLRGWLGFYRHYKSEFDTSIWPFPDEARRTLTRLVASRVPGRQPVPAVNQSGMRNLPEALSFAQGLIGLGLGLRAKPIFVPSGQYDPIFDRPRSYADVQGQIATNLANLKPHHARVKLRQGHTFVEHTIRTLPPAPGPATAGERKELAARVERIRRRSQRRYGRPRARVELEMVARQLGETGERDDRQIPTPESPTTPVSPSGPKPLSPTRRRARSEVQNDNIDS